MDSIERIKKDLFLYYCLVVTGVTLGGLSVIGLFLYMLVPGIYSMFAELFKRGFVVAVLGGGVSVLLIAPFSWSLYKLSRCSDPDRDLSNAHWERLKKGAYNLPLKLLIITLVFWPLATAIIGLWMWISGILTGGDAVRVGVCGLLYSPLQGIILYYLTRHALYRISEKLHGSTRWRFDRGGEGFGIRAKLTMSLLCLAVIPLVAGVLIEDVQREQSIVSRNLGEVCHVLSLIQASGPSGLEIGAWSDAVDWVKKDFHLSAQTEFQVADSSRRLLLGKESMTGEAKAAWYRTVAREDDGECLRAPVPGTRDFLVLRHFENPGVWISAVTRPFPEAMPFFSRFGRTIVLALVMIGLGVGLGFLAARDMGGPVMELSDKAKRASRGEYIEVASFLPDDEMSDLSIGFNALVGSIAKELSHSSGLVAQVREVIAGLGEHTDAILRLVEQQRVVVKEESSLSRQAKGKTEEIAKISREIKGKADVTRQRMNEASKAFGATDSTFSQVTRVMGEIVEVSERIATGMETQEQNYRRMEDVVRIIDDVAERTEILAFNAALESGGDREHGDRFAVVASEVQRLADRISEQTSAIKKLFGEMRGSSIEMVHAGSEGRERASRGPERIRELDQRIRVIEKSTSAASSSMQEIVGMAGNQDQSLEQLQTLVANVNTAASRLEEVSSGVERAVGRLNDLSERLGIMVKAELEIEEVPLETPAGVEEWEG